MSNVIIPFTICDNSIKGRIIKLDTEIDKILSQHKYPEPIERILAELILVSSIVASQFKDEITLSIQFQSEGAVKYIIADYQSPGLIRGYAQFQKDIDYSKKTYQDILNKGFLSVTLDRKLYNTQRYQGVVDVDNMTVSEAVEKYFYQSEQIQTSIKLSVGTLILPENKRKICAGGIMIQRLPGDDDHWHEANIYFNTIRDDELIDPNLSLEQLLYSLYHEVGVKIYDYVPILNKCRCSREKAEQILLSIGKKEALSLISENKIEISCQFCNNSQIFTTKEVVNLFSEKSELSKDSNALSNKKNPCAKVSVSDE